METTPDHRHGEAGFTLVEILAVLSLLAILMTIGAIGISKYREHSRKVETQTRISSLEIYITAYEAKMGDYPSDSLRASKIKYENDTNIGIEACVANLLSKDHPTGRNLPEDMLGNTDSDQTSTLYHRDGSQMLLEVVDSWGNPIAYMHNRSYEVGGVYMLSDPEERDPGMAEAPVSAAYSDVTGVWANADSYQLISAGPDEEYGTEDDITNFGD